jgi:hypothetical protein
MTTGLNTAGMTAQDAGGALVSSRKAARDNSGSPDALGFDAALAKSADDAQQGASPAIDPALSGSEAKATPLTTADAAPTAWAGMFSDGAALKDGAAKSYVALGAGDRLASRMASAWLDAAAPGASAPTLTAAASSQSGVIAGDPAVATATPAVGAQVQTKEQALAALATKDFAASPATDGAQQASTRTARTTDATAKATEQNALASFASGAKGSRPAAVADTPPAQRATKLGRASDNGSSSDSGATTTSAAAAPAPALIQPAFADATAAAAQMAQALAATPDVTAAASVVGNSAASLAPLADSVARIGAALSFPAAALSLSAAALASPAKAQTPGAAAVPEQDAKTASVHVVSQQSWLPPVDPALGGGGSDSSRNPAKDGGKETGPKLDGAVKSHAPPEGASVTLQSLPANFAAAQATLAGLPPATVLGASTNVSAATATAQVRQEIPSTPTPVLRRDLEITLTPQDLGDLQVKLKSSGDRLELAFVADRGETARMISDRSAALESQLNGAGLGLGGVAISSSAAGGMNGDANAGGSQGGGAAPRHDSQASGSPSGNAAGQSDSQSETTRQRQNFSGRAGQDDTHEPGNSSRDARDSAGDRGLYL